MNYPGLAREMIRIMNASQAMKDAQISLVTSPFSTSIRTVWLSIYHHAVNHNFFDKIESMQEGGKKELWAATKEICMGRELTKQQMIDVSKCLITIEYYLNAGND